jgi:hypothetical protein
MMFDLFTILMEILTIYLLINLKKVLCFNNNLKIFIIVLYVLIFYNLMCIILTLLWYI